MQGSIFDEIQGVWIYSCSQLSFKYLIYLLNQNIKTKEKTENCENLYLLLYLLLNYYFFCMKKDDDTGYSNLLHVVIFFALP